MATRKKVGTTAKKGTARRSLAKRSSAKRSVAKRGSAKQGGRKAASAKSAVAKGGQAVPAVTTKRSSATARSASKQQSTDPSVVSLAEYKRKRDFTRTREPAGKVVSRTSAKQKKLRFVIQKHAATQLHFDLRLELDGVMKSWAVPKGPSLDPTVKRLAMQVEDHPVDYNTFEGTIPEGEYGGGTVMLWDTGTYAPDTAAIAATGKSALALSRQSGSEMDGLSEEDIAREAYERGDFKIIFSGKRMRGTYVLVRTRGFGGRSSSKPSWLLIKHRDEYAEESPKQDLVEMYTTSVVTDRTMEEIEAAGT